MDNSNLNNEIMGESMLDSLKKRIPYNENLHKTKEDYDFLLETLIEDSINIGLSLKYPFNDYSDKTLPKKYNNWAIRCACELYNLAGNENIKSYSENGLNWEKFKSGLSTDLINEIVPSVGTIQSESVIEDV